MPGRGQTLARVAGKILESALGLLAMGMATAALLPAAASDPSPAQHPNLQGTWTLNEDLTARMRENDQQQRGSHEGSGGGMGRHGGGGHGGGRRGGGGFPGGSPGGSPGGTEGAGTDRPAEGGRPSLAALNTLTITQQSNEVTITDQEGHARTLRADGSKIRDDKAPGGPAEIQASWDKDGSLVVQVKPAKGPKRTESYIVSDDGKHLYLVLTMEGDGQRPAFKVRRAYDPTPPADRPAPADSGEDDELA